MPSPRVTRRTTLAALASGLVVNRAQAESSGKVIVVGAGLAGLAAARALHDAEVETLVLEARDRIGGRIWTSRRWPDLPMDMGASWIHGPLGNPITRLADAAGARRVTTNYDAAITLDRDGKRIDAAAATETADALVKAAREATYDFDADLSLEQAVIAYPGWADADPATRRVIRHMVTTWIEHEYSGSWSDLSAWYFDESDDFDGEDEVFPGGYDQITIHLAHGLDIRTSQTVSALAPDGAGIVVTLADGTQLRADHAVLTVPLGVLREGRITFAEPLEIARQTAIDGLRMGLLNKCCLRFDRISWPDDVHWIDWIGPQDGHFAQWISLAKPMGAPALVAFHADDQAREREALSDARMQSEAHAALKAMFGTSFPAPIDSQTTRWGQDPFSFGSYSFNAVGVTPDTRSALAGADWDGRLVFAGEATSSDHPSTAHGAVISGWEAARLILR